MSHSMHYRSFRRRSSQSIINVTRCHQRQKWKLWAGVVCAAHLCKFCYFFVTRGLPVSFPVHDPRAYFAYMAWHCTGQHCSSMDAWTYGLFASTWHPPVNVITTHSIMLQCIFIIECGIVHFLCAMRVFEVQASSSPARLPLCQILFRHPHCWASPHRKIVLSVNYSITHQTYLMPRELKISLRN